MKRRCSDLYASAKAGCAGSETGSKFSPVSPSSVFRRTLNFLIWTIFPWFFFEYVLYCLPDLLKRDLFDTWSRVTFGHMINATPVAAETFHRVRDGDRSGAIGRDLLWVGKKPSIMTTSQNTHTRGRNRCCHMHRGGLVRNDEACAFDNGGQFGDRGPTGPILDWQSSFFGEALAECVLLRVTTDYP